MSASDETLVRGIDLRAYRPADSYSALKINDDGRFDITDPTKWARIPHKGLNMTVGFVTDDLTGDGALFEESGPVLQTLEHKLTMSYPKGDAYLAILMAANDAGTPLPLIFAYSDLSDTSVRGYGGFWRVALSPQTDLKTFVKFEATFTPCRYLNVIPHKIGAAVTLPTYTAVNTTGGTWAGL